MITLADILIFLVLPFVITTIIYIAIMLILRTKNFYKNGKRKDKWRNLTPELLSSQIEYINNATYKAFELYIKIMLALLGGMSYVALNEQKNAKLLLQIGGIVLLSITLLFCIMEFVHQRAKIERWKKRFSWYEPLFWNECWWSSVSISLSLFVYYVFLTKLT